MNTSTQKLQKSLNDYKYTNTKIIKTIVIIINTSTQKSQKSLNNHKYTNTKITTTIK